jgi:hypothetical protein
MNDKLYIHYNFEEINEKTTYFFYLKLFFEL